MPTLERCFQWDIEETMVWTSLDADTADVWSVGGARLIFQEKIVFDEREIRKDSGIRLTQVDKDDNLKNQDGI
jgi:hypothetical protein